MSATALLPLAIPPVSAMSRGRALSFMQRQCRRALPRGQLELDSSAKVASFDERVERASAAFDHGNYPMPVTLRYELMSRSPHISAIQPAAARYGPKGIGISRSRP